MAIACDITGYIRNKEGKNVESKLYKDLQKILPASEVDNYYNFINSDIFKSQDNYKNLEFDENGQPTVASLIKNTDTVNKLISERVAERTILGNLKFSTVNGTWNSLHSALSDINKLNKSLETATDGTNIFRVALIKDYDKSTNRVVLKPVVYKVSSMTVMWEMKMQKIESDLQFLKKSEENSEVTMELLNSISYSVMRQFPTKEGEILALNQNIIPNIMKEGKENPTDAKLDIDTFKIASRLPIFDRVADILLHDKTADIRKFIEDNNLDIDWEDFEKNPNKYSNLILRTIWNKYQMDRTVLNYITGETSRKAADALIQRLQSATKDMWSKVNIPEQEKEIKLNDIPSPEVSSSENNKDFISTDKLIKELGDKYNILSNSEQSAIKLIKKIIEAEINQDKVQSRVHSDNPAFAIEQERKKALFKNLIDLYETGEYNLALYQYYVSTLNNLKKIQNKLDTLGGDIMSQATELRKMQLEIIMFQQVADYFNKHTNDIIYDKNELLEKILKVFNGMFGKNTLEALKVAKDNPIEFQEEIPELKPLADAYWELVNTEADNNVFRAINDKLSNISNHLYDLMYKKSKFLVTKVFEHYQDEESKITPWGKNKGKVNTVDDMLSRADREISVVQRLMDSMATSPDMLFRLMDKIVKIYKNNARLQAIEFAKKVKYEATLLENAGIRDTKWMYARDANGNKTGKYITEQDSEYYKIMENPAKKRFYEFFMANKEKLDTFYPPNTVNSDNIINIRKDSLERLKESDSVKSAAKKFWQNVKDDWTNQSQEDQDMRIGYTDSAYTLEGEEILMLPIYYNNIDFKNPEKVNEISEDAVSTLIAYGAKAYDYSQMNKIINILELTKEVLKEREIPLSKNGKKIVTITRKMIKGEGEELTEEDALTYKDGGHSQNSKMFKGYLDILYGRIVEDDTMIGKVSLVKMVDKINGWTARAALSLSLLNGVSNYLTGETMITYGALQKRYFTLKDWGWAKVTYDKALIAHLGNKGKRIKDDKLSLFIEMFDVGVHYDKDMLRDENWDRKTKLGRIKFGEAMMFMQDAGEHKMACETALAQAHRIMLKDKDGNLHNLWDSLEEEYIQEDGSWGKTNKKLGARLKIKDGYTKQDGTNFTNNDIVNTQMLFASVLHGDQGIYNQLDMNQIQRKAAGRAVYLFRKWVWESYRRRFGKLGYDFERKEWNEGYYRSVYDFMMTLSEDLKSANFNMQMHWDELSELQKQNCKKVLIETAIVISLMLSAWLMYHYGDDDNDKENNSFVYNEILYYIIRLSSETNALSPFGMINESTRYAKNLFPMINTLTTVLDSFKALWPPNWFEEVKSGWAKGHSKGFKYLFGNKVINPYYLIMQKNLNPENEINTFF